MSNQSSGDQPKNNVIDSKLFKKNKELAKETLVDDIIKGLALFHKNTDDGLKELAELCKKDKCGK
jgi:hypothetical protein